MGLALALVLVAACGSSASVSGTGGVPSTGSGGSSTGGTSGGTPGSGGTGLATGGAVGSMASGGAAVVTGSGGRAGGVGGVAGSGAGSGGAPAVGGNSGSAGGSSGVPACPANATFCSGFETPGMPAGAVYKANAAPGDWTRDFALDPAVHHAGAASLRVKASTEGGVSGSYRMLAVPTPGPAFWVRLYILQMDADIGSVDHNVFAGASGSDDPNDSVMVEMAEDVGLAFNAHDIVRWPVGFGRTTTGGTNPFTLAKGMWHCIEISYDSTARAQKLFVNGTLQIDAVDFPAASTPPSNPFKVFKFGFYELHGPTRKIWYDDVAVAPQRIPCL